MSRPHLRVSLALALHDTDAVIFEYRILMNE